MATNICGTCLRTALRQRNAVVARTFKPSSRFTPSIATFSRSLTSSTRLHNTTEASLASTASATRQALNATSAEKIDVSMIQGGTLDTYAAYGATEILYKECADAGAYWMSGAEEGKDGRGRDGVEGVDGGHGRDGERAGKAVEVLQDGTEVGIGRGWWYSELGLQPTFTSWTQITMLHMYLISARLRCLTPEVTQTWQQHFIDHFFTDAENRMIVNHGLESRGARNGYLKDLFLQWRGILLAYDEGIVKGDAVLAAAVWRNLFNADPEVDVVKLGQIVGFMRRSLKDLEAMSDRQLVAGGKMFDNGPDKEGDVVSRRSPLMDLPLEQAPGKPLPATVKGGKAAKKS